MADDRVELLVRRPKHDYRQGAVVSARVRKSNSIWVPGFAAETITVERHPGCLTVKFKDSEGHTGDFALSLENAIRLIDVMSESVHRWQLDGGDD